MCQEGEGRLLWTSFTLVPGTERGLITGVHQVCTVCTSFSLVSPKRNTAHMLQGYPMTGLNQVCFKTAPLILTKTLLYSLHYFSLSKKIQLHLSLNTAYRQFIQTKTPFAYFTNCHKLNWRDQLCSKYNLGAIFIVKMTGYKALQF